LCRSAWQHVTSASGHAKQSLQAALSLTLPPANSTQQARYNLLSQPCWLALTCPSPAPCHALTCPLTCCGAAHHSGHTCSTHHTPQAAQARKVSYASQSAAPPSVSQPLPWVRVSELPCRVASCAATGLRSQPASQPGCAASPGAAIPLPAALPAAVTAALTTTPAKHKQLPSEPAADVLQLPILMLGELATRAVTSCSSS
jgi:hypothetical protein